MAKANANSNLPKTRKGVTYYADSQALHVTVAPSKKWKPETGYPAAINLQLPFSKKAHKSNSLASIRKALKDALHWIEAQQEAKATKESGSI